MKTKDDFIKALRSDPQYLRALKMAKNAEERKKIIATVEGFVNNFTAVLIPVFEKVESDPKFASELRLALKNGGRVINEEDKQPVTGSVI